MLLTRGFCSFKRVFLFVMPACWSVWGKWWQTVATGRTTLHVLPDKSPPLSSTAAGLSLLDTVTVSAFMDVPLGEDGATTAMLQRNQDDKSGLMVATTRKVPLERRSLTVPMKNQCWSWMPG